jgi:hypothetical protein
LIFMSLPKIADFRIENSDMSKFYYRGDIN